jgi:hypothetical protein
VQEAEPRPLDDGLDDGGFLGSKEQSANDHESAVGQDREGHQNRTIDTLTDCLKASKSGPADHPADRAGEPGRRFGDWRDASAS